MSDECRFGVGRTVERSSPHWRRRQNSQTCLLPTAANIAATRTWSKTHSEPNNKSYQAYAESVAVYSAQKTSFSYKTSGAAAFISTVKQQEKPAIVSSDMAKPPHSAQSRRIFRKHSSLDGAKRVKRYHRIHCLDKSEFRKRA